MTELPTRERTSAVMEAKECMETMRLQRDLARDEAQSLREHVNRLQSQVAHLSARCASLRAEQAKRTGQAINNAATATSGNNTGET